MFCALREYRRFNQWHDIEIGRPEELLIQILKVEN
jgi:hypothetical protein